MNSGGKSLNIVDEYDKTYNLWRKINTLNHNISGYLIELRPDIEIHFGDWYVLY